MLKIVLEAVKSWKICNVYCECLTVMIEKLKILKISENIPPNCEYVDFENALAILDVQVEH